VKISKILNFKFTLEKKKLSVFWVKKSEDLSQKFIYSFDPHFAFKIFHSFGPLSASALLVLPRAKGHDICVRWGHTILA
jgi:hypothetical protein